MKKAFLLMALSMFAFIGMSASAPPQRDSVAITVEPVNYKLNNTEVFTFDVLSDKIITSAAIASYDFLSFIPGAYGNLRNTMLVHEDPGSCSKNYNLYTYIFTAPQTDQENVTLHIDPGSCSLNKKI